MLPKWYYVIQLAEKTHGEVLLIFVAAGSAFLPMILLIHFIYVTRNHEPAYCIFQHQWQHPFPQLPTVILSIYSPEIELYHCWIYPVTTKTTSYTTRNIYCLFERQKWISSRTMTQSIELLISLCSTNWVNAQQVSIQQICFEQMGEAFKVMPHAYNWEMSGRTKLIKLPWKSSASKWENFLWMWT